MLRLLYGTIEQAKENAMPILRDEGAGKLCSRSYSCFSNIDLANIDCIPYY